MKYATRGFFFTAVLSVGVLVFAQLTPEGNTKQSHGPGNLKVLDGYQHVPLRGIDSIVGKIQHKDGFEIFYEKGRVVKPGAPRLGGDFSNAAARLKNSQNKNIEWSAQQKIGDQPVDLVLLKDGRLVASFPEAGINFTAKTKTKAQVADVLVMVMTYPVKQK